MSRRRGTERRSVSKRRRKRKTRRRLAWSRGRGQAELDEFFVWGKKDLDKEKDEVGGKEAERRDDAEDDKERRTRMTKMTI